MQGIGIVIVTDGWRKRAAAQGTPLVNVVVLKPNGGALFLRIEDVSEQRKDAASIVEFHEKVMMEASGMLICS
jgi:hypothetical protein